MVYKLGNSELYWEWLFEFDYNLKEIYFRLNIFWVI